MAVRVAGFEVLGLWSLRTSRRFWEGFTPAALAGEPARSELRTVFGAEGDWHRAEAEVTQAGDTAHVALAGGGDLEAAAPASMLQRASPASTGGIAGRA